MQAEKGMKAGAQAFISNPQGLRLCFEVSRLRSDWSVQIKRSSISVSSTGVSPKKHKKGRSWEILGGQADYHRALGEVISKT